MNKPDFKKPQDFHRHIIFNEIERIIYIEVRTDIQGRPLTQEYQNIKHGRFHEYIPLPFKLQVAQVVQQGFKVVPFIAYGYQVGDTSVISIVGFTEKNIISAGY